MAYDILSLLQYVNEKGASDVFIDSGSPVTMKIKGEMFPYDDVKVLPKLADEIIGGIYALADRDLTKLKETGDDDFSFSVSGLSRFRVCAFKQRGSLAAVIRTVVFEIPDPKSIHIPDEVILPIRDMKKGLVLVTGPAGSGKSTTLACIIDAINTTRTGHIITMEDPIEYIHRDKKCIVSQREIKTDTADFITAVRSSLRQAPDVILVGEMRDYETIRTVITAAETGHLVISTLHSIGAVNTVDRIIDVFPPNQQQQIRVQLSMVLRTVISQQLVQTNDGTFSPVFEVMHVNNAIRNMIRESKVHQIDTIISNSSREGMMSMDAGLLSLVRERKISKDTALMCASSPEVLEKRMSML